MNNRNILSFHIVHHNLADFGLCNDVTIPNKEEVASLKCGLHGAGEDDDNGRRGVGDNGKTLPHHERRREDQGEVEELCGGLPGILECGQHGGDEG